MARILIIAFAALCIGLLTPGSWAQGTWDSYIDWLLAYSGGSADKAAIIGKDGYLWTTGGHASSLKITALEAAVIGRVFSSGRDLTPFITNGVVAEGVKYQFLRRVDGKLVTAKKKDYGALSLQASNTAVVIAHTKEGGFQGNTDKAVAVMAEYLESMGL